MHLHHTFYIVDETSCGLSILKSKPWAKYGISVGLLGRGCVKHALLKKILNQNQCLQEIVLDDIVPAAHL